MKILLNSLVLILLATFVGCVADKGSDTNAKNKNKTSEQIQVSSQKGKDVVNGVCRFDQGQSFEKLPAADLCIFGTMESFSGTGPWKWLCVGSGGGLTSSCSINKTVVVVSTLAPVVVVPPPAPVVVVPPTPPVVVPNISSSNISAGAYHTCLIVNGGAKCWGANFYGQLGIPSSSIPSYHAVEVSGLPAGSGVTAIAGGYNHTCAIIQGAAKCWGINDYGQLGNNTTVNSSVPVQVEGLTSGVTAIAAGTRHTCAVVNGAVKCWGGNTGGTLGNGSALSSLIPTLLPGLESGVSAITSGADFGCAVINGIVKCWGNGINYGKTPTQVAGLSGVIAISGSSQHACAIVTGGAVKCWGYNVYGQLGANVGLFQYSAAAVSIPEIAQGATAISAAGNHACAVVSNNVHCWGGNMYGQLGDGTNRDNSIPLPVLSATGILTGYHFSCAIVEQSRVRCWGANNVFQLGSNSSNESAFPIAAVDFQ